MRVCDHCKREYVSKSGHQRFCSKDCWHDFNLRRYREHDRATRPIGRDCVGCGRWFDFKQDRDGKIIRHRKFCSEECRQARPSEHARGRYARYLQKHPEAAEQVKELMKAIEKDHAQ